MILVDSFSNLSWENGLIFPIIMSMLGFFFVYLFCFKRFWLAYVFGCYWSFAGCKETPERQSTNAKKYGLCIMEPFKWHWVESKSAVVVGKNEFWHTFLPVCSPQFSLTHACSGLQTAGKMICYRHKDFHFHLRKRYPTCEFLMKRFEDAHIYGHSHSAFV